MRREGPPGSHSLRVLAPAKINLRLEVLGRRADGYHELRTIMQTVSLYDELVFSTRQGPEVVLEASGAELPPPGENLVMRAALLLQERLRRPRGASIRLRKRIPVGRGFGGGSSDCAAALLALNVLWGAGLSVEELQELAGQLGSDVPFFLYGGAALCEGRGERVTPLEAGGTFHYVLLIPPQPVATASVYAALDDGLTGRGGAGTIEDARVALERGDAAALAASLYNALEAPAIRVSGEVRQVVEAVSSLSPPAGWLGYCLSGSGSGFFVLCDDGEHADAAARELGHGLGVRAVHVSSTPPVGTLPGSVSGGES